jgi:hypothetical protein
MGKPLGIPTNIRLEWMLHSVTNNSAKHDIKLITTVKGCIMQAIRANTKQFFKDFVS